MVGATAGARYAGMMLVRLFMMLALTLSTLPAPAAAAPACHDEPVAMAGHAMATEHAMPAPEPSPGQPPEMGETLCVGCIAPATLRAARVAPPHALAVTHGRPPRMAGSPAAAPAPEPPPPRG